MGRQVRRAFKYRFYPTGEQAVELSRTFGCVRLVYNKVLEERPRAWTDEQRRISYAQSSAALTHWRKTAEPAFLAEVSRVPLQQALRHLQTAFSQDTITAAPATDAAVGVDAGLAVTACGDDGRPQRDTSRTGRSSAKQETQRATAGTSRP